MNMLSCATKPDILFLDINMPYKHGLDWLVETRAQAEFSGLPIVIMSSTREAKFIHTFYGMGRYLLYQAKFIQ
jgi:DNA-binding response OmpR family regulator